jgi:hypothetical protein
MLKFQIVLKNEKAKTYTVISWLIIALNFVFFLYIGVSGSSGIMTLPFFAAGLLICIFIFKSISKREEIENDCLSLAFSVSIIVLIVMQFYWLAALIILLFLFQDITRRRLTVLVFDDRIVYPSFPKRTILWKELNNVILKDDILTIDLRNNKIFQNEVISPVSDIEFNEYCNLHLHSLN